MTKTKAPAQTTYVMKMCARQWCNHEVVPKPTGRPGLYCSDACKQSDYRIRRDNAAAKARKEEAERAAAHRLRSLADAISAELAGTRLSLTQQKEMGTRLAKLAIVRLSRQMELF